MDMMRGFGTLISMYEKEIMFQETSLKVSVAHPRQTDADYHSQ